MTARIRRLSLSVIALMGLLAGVAMPASGQAPGAPAQLVAYEPPIREESYKYTDFGKKASAKDDTTGKAKFRVIERTGNCCENYITIDKKGTVYDFGGAYVNFTEDDGKTWTQVKPIEPLVNGEGTIAMAPNGDVIGVEWDPYSGDHLLSMKYDAAADQWLYLEMPLHTPFYDREWLTVVPGPFTISGVEVPYVVFVDGAPHAGPLLYSTDGLTYVQVSNTVVDSQLEPAVEGWLDIQKDKSLEWVQPNTNSPVTPIGNGYAITIPGGFNTSWGLFNAETQRWGAITFPEGGDLPDRVQVDSKGRLHAIVPGGEQFEYRISKNGGKSWKSSLISMPEGASMTGGMQMDFRVNASIGVAAVAFHGNGPAGDADYVFTLDISGKKAKAMRLYEIGLGDINASSGVGQDIRFDFETVALFPDGRIAVSFLDSTTGPVFSLTSTVMDRLGPALAIEL